MLPIIARLRDERHGCRRSEIAPTIWRTRPCLGMCPRSVIASPSCPLLPLFLVAPLPGRQDFGQSLPCQQYPGGAGFSGNFVTIGLPAAAALVDPQFDGLHRRHPRQAGPRTASGTTWSLVFAHDTSRRNTLHQPAAPSTTNCMNRFYTQRPFETPRRRLVLNPRSCRRRRLTNPSRLAAIIRERRPIRSSVSRRSPTADSAEPLTPLCVSQSKFRTGNH